MAKSPKEVFEQEIPARFAEHKGKLSDAQKAVAMKVGVSIAGAGDWTIAFGGGDLTVTTGLAGDCQVTLWQSLKSFEEALKGATGISAAGMSMDNFDPSKLKPAMADRVKMIKGTLKVEVLEGTNTVFDMMVGFGPGAQPTPTCTITTQEADAALMREGKMLPQQAFMAGKIKIVGDMNLAMQVGSLQMIQ